MDDPLRVLDVNVIGTRNVLELSRQHGTRVVFASTSEVFGKNPNPPFAEDDDRVLGSTKTARWSYSTSKAMAEHLVFAMHSAYELPVTVVRYFNVYGPRQAPIFVVSQSVHRILNGHRPYLFDTGDQTRCFTYVDDAVAGTLLAAESNAAIGEAFNIGSMTETSMREVVNLAIKTADVDSVSEAEPVDTAERYGGRYEDIPRRIPDSTKAQRELGWRLTVDVAEGIRRTIDWARANPWYLKESAGPPR
jgi:UDP-glucose 4-epimerase